MKTLDAFGFDWPFEESVLQYGRLLLFLIDVCEEKTNPHVKRLLDERGGEILFVDWQCFGKDLCELCRGCPEEEREKVHTFFRRIQPVQVDETCKKELVKFVNLYRSGLLESRAIARQLPHLYKKDCFVGVHHSKKKLETDNMNSESTPSASQVASLAVDVMEEYKILKNRTAYHSNCIENFWFNFPLRRPEVVKTMERVVELQKPVYNKLKRLHNSLTKTAEAPTRSAEEEEGVAPVKKAKEEDHPVAKSTDDTEAAADAADSAPPAEEETLVVDDEEVPE